jgi:hypothetical protein
MSGKKKNSRKKNTAQAQNTAQNAPRAEQKAYAPKSDSKPLILRILVLTMAAVLILGMVVGTVATGAGF